MAVRPAGPRPSFAVGVVLKRRRGRPIPLRRGAGPAGDRDPLRGARRRLRVSPAPTLCPRRRRARAVGCARATRFGRSTAFRSTRLRRGAPSSWPGHRCAFRCACRWRRAPALRRACNSSPRRVWRSRASGASPRRTSIAIASLMVATRRAGRRRSRRCCRRFGHERLRLDGAVARAEPLSAVVWRGGRLERVAPSARWRRRFRRLPACARSTAFACSPCRSAGTRCVGAIDRAFARAAQQTRSAGRPGDGLDPTMPGTNGVLINEPLAVHFGLARRLDPAGAPRPATYQSRCSPSTAPTTSPATRAAC